MSHLDRTPITPASRRQDIFPRYDRSFREFTGYTPPAMPFAPSDVRNEVSSEAEFDAAVERIAAERRGDAGGSLALHHAVAGFAQIVAVEPVAGFGVPADLGAVEPEPALYEDHDGNQSSGEREAMPLILLAGLIGFALIGWIGWRLAAGAFGG